MSLFLIGKVCAQINLFTIDTAEVDSILITDSVFLNGITNTVIHKNGIAHYTSDGNGWIKDWILPDTTKSFIPIIIESDTLPEFDNLKYPVGFTIKVKNGQTYESNATKWIKYNEEEITVVNSYDELRMRNSNTLSGLIFVKNFTYQFNNQTYQTIGGFFTKDSIGQEDGGTVLKLNDNTVVKRQWDHINIIPEWWEIGGYNWEGTPYTDYRDNSGGIFNERDRVESACRKALNIKSAPTVHLKPGKTYEIDIKLNLSAELNGHGAIIKRPNVITASLTSSANSGHNSINVDKADLFRVGQEILILNGPNIDENSRKQIITKIIGNQLNLSSPFGQINGSFPSGSQVISTGTLIGPIANSITNRILIKNVNFDGNRSENNYTIDWKVNTIIQDGSNPYTTIENCHFKNSSNETIVVAKGLIKNCRYDSIGGSFLHVSNGRNPGDKEGIVITACSGVVSNLNNSDDAGHGYGVIAYSVKVINLFVDNCTFSNGNYCFGIGDLNDARYKIHNSKFTNFNRITWVNVNGGGTQYIDLKNNTFISCGDILFTDAAGNMSSGEGIDRVTISGNTFVNARAKFSGITQTNISNNGFYFEDSLHNFIAALDWATSLDGNEAMISFDYSFDQVSFSNNKIMGPIEYYPKVNNGLALYVREVRKDQGVDSDYWYPQNVLVNNNVIANFRYGLTTRPRTVHIPRTRQFIGWRYSNNLIYDNQNVNGDGVGIYVDCGIVAESNTIYHYSTAITSAGLYVIGVDSTGDKNTLLGGIAKNNTIFSAPNTNSIIIGSYNGDYNHFNAICLNNIYSGILNDQSAGFSVNQFNLKLDAVTLPALTNFQIPLIKGWREDYKDY